MANGCKFPYYRDSASTAFNTVSFPGMRTFFSTACVIGMYFTIVGTNFRGLLTMVAIFRIYNDVNFNTFKF